MKIEASGGPGAAIPAVRLERAVSASRGLAVALFAFVLSAACASVQTNGRTVRLVTDRAAVQGCELLTIEKDNDLDDLKEKAAEAGGNTALIVGQAGSDVAFIVKFSRIKFIGEVYRCK